jgi:hypothetical protein
MRLQPFVTVLFGVFSVTCASAQVPASPERSVPPSSPTEVGTALWRGMVVHYLMRNGLPVWQGDMILDHLAFGTDFAAALPLRNQGSRGTADPDEKHSDSLGMICPFDLWPAVGGIYQIPYIITNGTANLKTAIAYYNTAFARLIQWVPLTTETDYIYFYVNPSDQSGAGDINAYGRLGGEQKIGCGTGCSVGTFLHEMGHPLAYGTRTRAPTAALISHWTTAHIRADMIADQYRHRPGLYLRSVRLRVNNGAKRLQHDHRWIPDNTEHTGGNSSVVRNNVRGLHSRSGSLHYRGH